MDDLIILNRSMSIFIQRKIKLSFNFIILLPGLSLTVLEIITIFQYSLYVLQVNSKCVCFRHNRKSVIFKNNFTIKSNCFYLKHYFETIIMFYGSTHYRWNILYVQSFVTNDKCLQHNRNQTEIRLLRITSKRHDN